VREWRVTIRGGRKFMNNTTAIGIYVPLLLMQIAVFISAIVTFLKTRRNNMFMFLCICIIGWLICDIAILFIENAALNIYIWNIGLIFVGFSPLATFFVFFRYYLPKYKIPLYVVILIFVIPTLNALIAITSSHHSLIREVEIISLSPIRIVEITWGGVVLGAYCVLLCFFYRRCRHVDLRLHTNAEIL